MSDQILSPAAPASDVEGTVQTDIEQPGVARGGTARPGAAQLDGTVQPGTSQPGAAQLDDTVQLATTLAPPHLAAPATRSARRSSRTPAGGHLHAEAISAWF